MATLVLSTAGATLGGAFGGAAGAAAGRALGAVAGSMLDQALLGQGARAVETEPLPALRIASAREGAPIPRVFGRMRVAGRAIWAARFRVDAGTQRASGKAGAGRVVGRERRVTASFALALCEGPIDRIGRFWADGREIDRTSMTWRLHRGTEDQVADPLIAALEGTDRAPAYRGVAYVVIEDLDLSPYGERIPRLEIEVFRQPRVDRARTPEIAPPLGEMIRGVALSPGSGEFCLETVPVRRRLRPGRAVAENVHSLSGRADLLEALDQLAAEAPACRSVSLVVSWFGDDLRCSRCLVQPGVEERDKATEPVEWRAAGLSRAEARLVGRTPEGRPVYGGTPSDGSVIAAIGELRRRGYRVMLYPFLLMDVPPDNALPDPWGGARQPAYPWRGRITLERAAGVTGSADQTAAARAEVAAFFGAARPEHFTSDGETLRYDGPSEWGWRRFVLHYAHLCAAAGGVDAFCIGSELRGITTIRDGRASYPAVAALRALAADVRAILGPATKIGYAADWSEYFGHQPADGSGDAIFHLDSLWADPSVDFVGIDNYLPLSDWRDGYDHIDAATARDPADLDYLRRGVEGGEHFDWHYATMSDRVAQRRTLITDGAYGEPWLFRPKDVRGWWSNPHHDRIGGVRTAEPTPWVPCAKPIWFTEIGCGAIDKGANQPNLFVDPKSSESGFPHFSTGARDAFLQRRFLQASLGWWSESARNPVSPVYGGPMVDPDAIHVWTWDARPWPAFPERTDVWADGVNWRLGHWINGRMASAGLQEIVAEICATAGVAEVDVSALRGLVDGYAIEEAGTARQALQPLMLAHGFDAVETGGRLRFVMRGGRAVAEIGTNDVLLPSGEASSGFVFERGAASEAPAATRLSYPASDAGYETAAAASLPPLAAVGRLESASTTVAMASDEAQALADRWRADGGVARSTVRFALPPSRLALEPGDVVKVVAPEGLRRYRVDRIESAEGLTVVASKDDAPNLAAPAPPAPPPSPVALVAAQPMAFALIDAAIPEAWGGGAPLAAAFAEPWPGEAAIWRSDGATGFALVGRVAAPATMGVLSTPLEAASAARWSGASVDVDLWGGALRTASRLGALNGANRAAIESPRGGWELIQFAGATLVGPDRWRLTDLLRGQGATEGMIGDPTPAGARFVLLDDALAPLVWSPADRGLKRRWRVGPAARPHDDPVFVEIAFAVTEAWGRPPAPSRLCAARDADGGFTLSWVRRNRLDADGWTDGLGFDAGGTATWRVRVVRAGSILRETVTNVATLRYEAAQRQADGVAPPFEFTVAEVSADAGMGDEARITVHG